MSLSRAIAEGVATLAVLGVAILVMLALVFGGAAPVKPKPAQPKLASIIGHPTTVNDIFTMLKTEPIDPDTFNALLSFAGVAELPEPPEGWQYGRTTKGIVLKKTEDLTRKIPRLK